MTRKDPAGGDSPPAGSRLLSRPLAISPRLTFLLIGCIALAGIVVMCFVVLLLAVLR